MEHLNYISEINAFYDWLESNRLNSSTIALWHALMSVANKARWSSDFSVAISTLQSKTGMGKDAIYAARNQLRQRGRIDFKERKGNQSAVYRIIPFASEKPTQQAQPPPFVSEYQTQPPTQPPTQSSTQSSTQTPTQTPNINKQNKTRLNETSSIYQSAADSSLDLTEGLTEILENIFFVGAVPQQWVGSVKDAIFRMYYSEGISVGGAFINQERVRERLKLLDSETIQWAIDRIADSGEDIKNPCAYLMAYLYNAPADYDTALNIQVSRDLG